MFTKPVTGCVRGDGIGDRARHRSQRRVMQHEVHARASFPAQGEITHVDGQEPVAPGRLCAARLIDLLDVGALSAAQVVQAHHLLFQAQQRLDQMRADEPGGAADQPPIAPPT
jgi:hypothetical protein